MISLQMSAVRIAILASGSGSNAQRIMEHFKENPNIQVAAVITNNPIAGVIQRAEKANVPVEILKKEKEMF